MILLTSVIIVILSIILHEVAHGYAADRLGDPTARYSGRLTLNPLPHIDPVGSIIIPGLLALTNSPFLIGWAKPVPYNPYNLRNQRWGEALVAAAGPATNLLIAIAFGLVVRYSAPFGLSQQFLAICATAAYFNIVLAVYNLIPLPPLDGAKILSALLPTRARMAFNGFERYIYALGPLGLVAVGIFAIYLLWPVLSLAVGWFFVLVTGT